MAGPYQLGNNPGVGSEGPPHNSSGASLNTYASQFTSGSSKNFINNIMTWNGRPATPRKHFFNFLEKWETTLPLQSLWMIFFDIPPAVQDEAMKYYGELHMNEAWGVNEARKRLTIDGAGSFNADYGCTFAQTVGIPAEQMGVDPLGQGNRGFLKMPIVNH